MMKTEYILEEILCGDNKLIIPDLQRDYCWAEHGLIKQFLSGLIAQFKDPEQKEKKLNMGLLYWYRGLHGYWQLCDGQQRITTLFLCLGVLNRMCEGNPFSDMLISPFELMEDDKEPRLQYAIRESSLYFMSDLVCRFFLDKSIGTSEEIPSQPWFFNDYRFDPSIKNYLAAIKEIEELVSDIEPEAFGNYLSTKLEFHCHDMGSRKDGEETFVIINTTGEPLTPTENLKPHIIIENINEPNIAQRWEAVEHFFWKHRGENETSDAGLNEFLRVVSLLNAFVTNDKKYFFSILRSDRPLVFDYHRIQFSEIESCLNAYAIFLNIKPLSDSNAARRGLRYPDSNKPFSLLALFTLLPSLLFVKQHADATIADIARVQHLFANVVRYQDVGSDDSSLSPWDALELISKLTESNDVINLISQDSLDELLAERPQAVFPNEERLKLFVIKNAPAAEREDIEKAFAIAEDYWLFDGEIRSIVSYSMSGSLFDESRFKQMYHNAKRLWDTEERNELRCALLTLNLPEYPIVYSGPTKSLGYSRGNWKEIYKKNCTADSLMTFIEGLNEMDDVLAYLKGIANAFDCTDATVYPLVKNIKYIDYCRDRFITIGDHIILLNPKIRASGWVYLFDGHKVRYPDNNKFGRCYIWENKTLYTDHVKFDIGIDLVYQGLSDYRIDVFERGNGRPRYLGLFDEVTKLGFQGEGTRRSFSSTSIDEILDMYFTVRQIAIL